MRIRPDKLDVYAAILGVALIGAVLFFYFVWMMALVQAFREVYP